mmetsp:Transcript_78167/g.226755  ORF Transcript_78167/g.226755 Transcript_78167/m.226755 type:complete len:205 (-) Transcript_78167:22-636(-)
MPHVLRRQFLDDLAPLFLRLLARVGLKVQRQALRVQCPRGEARRRARRDRYVQHPAHQAHLLLQLVRALLSRRPDTALVDDRDLRVQRLLQALPLLARLLGLGDLLEQRLPAGRQVLPRLFDLLHHAIAVARQPLLTLRLPSGEVPAHQPLGPEHEVVLEPVPLLVQRRLLLPQTLQQGGVRLHDLFLRQAIACNCVGRCSAIG